MHAFCLLNTLLKIDLKRVFSAFLPQRNGFALPGELQSCRLQRTEAKACSAPDPQFLRVIQA